MVEKKRKKRITGSLRTQIALLYMGLAMGNIVFFSVMIYDSMTDLQKNNYKLQSDNLINAVLSGLQQIRISKNRDASYEHLTKLLAEYRIEKFRVFDSKGKVWHREPGDLPDKVDDALLIKTIELSSDNPIYTARYYKELDVANYQVKFLIPLSTSKNGVDQKIFLDAAMSVEEMKKSQATVYSIIFLAASWGIVFHILFGIYVYRLIFVRVNILKETSDRMAGGDLTTRANWKQKRDDELDDLGNAFNEMAERIEDQVETVTRLNHEIQSELEIGKEVQGIFIPDNSFFQDYDIQIFFRPMREVSGDIYNFYNYQSGSKGLFFADATGHGVSAALVTTITVMSLDEIMKETGVPNKVLMRLNNILASKLEASFFATGIYIKLSPGRLHVSNAGHNAPLLFQEKGEKIVELEKGGPPLGMMEDYEYEAAVVKVKPGDRLLVYSDGLVETPSPDGEQFGMERVISLIKEHIDESNEAIKDLLSSELEKHSHGVYNDDVSIMMLEIPS